MPTPNPAAMTRPGGAPALVPVNLSNLPAKELAGLLVAPPPQLLVDCAGHLLPHQLGVCRFVAQLLQLRLRGTCLWLCNVHPGLRRYLSQLKLDAVFHLLGETLPAGATPQGWKH